MNEETKNRIDGLVNSSDMAMLDTIMQALCQDLTSEGFHKYDIRQYIELKVNKLLTKY